MKIVATYIIRDLREYENDSYYKLHECIGINTFTKEYYREINGDLSRLGTDFAKELLEHYAK